MTKRYAKKTLPWLAVVTWMGVIFLLSHQSVSESDALSSRITDTLRRIIQTIFPSVAINMDTFHQIIEKGLYAGSLLILVVIVIYAFRFPKHKGSITGILPWLGILLWMAFLFSLTNQPGEHVSGWSAEIANTLRGFIQTVLPSLSLETMTFHQLIRKSAHFFAYMLLGMLTLHALQPPLLKGALIALFISIVYAVTDEIHQLFVPGRGGELRDVMIDGMGAAAGIVVYLVFAFIFMVLFRKRTSGKKRRR